MRGQQSHCAKQINQEDCIDVALVFSLYKLRERMKAALCSEDVLKKTCWKKYLCSISIFAAVNEFGLIIYRATQG